MLKSAASIVVDDVMLPDGSKVTLSWDKHAWGSGSGYAFEHIYEAPDGLWHTRHKSKPYPPTDAGKALAMRAFKNYVGRRQREMSGTMTANKERKMTKQQAQSWVQHNCKFANYMPRSSTLQVYKDWLAAASPEQVAFVDSVYEMCEKNYEAGGDTIVETMTPAEVLGQFKTLNDAREFSGLMVEKQLNSRWGEDTDPELGRSKKFDAWKQSPI